MSSPLFTVPIKLHDQVPLAKTVVLQVAPEEPVTVTKAPGSPVPETGVPLVGELITGAAGATLIVMVSGAVKVSDIVKLVSVPVTVTELLKVLLPAVKIPEPAVKLLITDLVSFAPFFASYGPTKLVKSVPTSVEVSDKNSTWKVSVPLLTRF